MNDNHEAEQENNYDNSNNEELENKKPIDIDPEKEYSFGKELHSYIAHITSLYKTLDLTIRTIEDNFDKTRKKLEDFINEYCKVEDEGETKSILIKADQYREFQLINYELSTYGIAFKTIPRSFFIYLISQYDSFLSKLIEIVFILQPKILNTSEKNISFSELVSFGSIDDAKKFIMEKKIEDIMRQNHASQLKWVQNTFNLQFVEDLDIWPEFIELTERRNLFVHTDGKISSQYIRVCDENDVGCKDAKVGEELHVDRDYFNKAYNVVFELGFILAHILWRKFKPNDLAQADNNLIAIGYDTLCEENYYLSKKIFDFSLHYLKKYSNEEARRIMIVNRSQSYKWSGDDSLARQQIMDEDWTASQDKFILSEAVILENYDTAYEILRRIGKNNKELTASDYRDWPLFKAIREEQEFIDTFQEIFNEPLNKIEEELKDKIDIEEG